MQNIPPQINILGVNICATNMSNVLTTIERWIEHGERHYVCVRDVHGVMECQNDEDLRQIHNNSGLTVPDGMPIVWAGWLKGFDHMSRVYGPDLMLEICELSVKNGYTHFLYGGNKGVAKELQENLERRFPGIRIVGIYTPSFRPLNNNEERKLRKQMAQLKPDLFWVGLSTPKQERFMAEYIQKLDTKIMLGVGAAFDIHAGRTRDAPDWIKKIGMQWLHRLYQEPRRLWRRYLYNNPVFVYKYIKQLMTGKY